MSFLLLGSCVTSLISCFFFFYLCNRKFCILFSEIIHVEALSRNGKGEDCKGLSWNTRKTSSDPG